MAKLPVKALFSLVFVVISPISIPVICMAFGNLRLQGNLERLIKAMCGFLGTTCSPLLLARTMPGMCRDMLHIVAISAK